MRFPGSLSKIVSSWQTKGPLLFWILWPLYLFFCTNLFFLPFTGSALLCENFSTRGPFLLPSAGTTQSIGLYWLNVDLLANPLIRSPFPLANVRISSRPDFHFSLNIGTAGFSPPNSPFKKTTEPTVRGSLSLPLPPSKEQVHNSVPLSLLTKPSYLHSSLGTGPPSVDHHSEYRPTLFVTDPGPPRFS